MNLSQFDSQIRKIKTRMIDCDLVNTRHALVSRSGEFMWITIEALKYVSI